MELLVGMDATLTGGRSGVSFSPSSGATDAGAYIHNQGAISGGAGIVAKAYGLEIENEGTIVGTSGAAIVNSGATSEIRNAGIIDGYTAAVRTVGDLRLINKGSIHSENVAISVSDGTASIVNKGMIYGSVRLGSGDDWFNSLGGTIDGDVNLGNGSDNFYGSGTKGRFSVAGGKGDDSYFMVDKAYAIRELQNQGTDYVEINASYTLKSWLEGLVLAGTGNFDATGNETFNDLIGNDGDNHISGMGGRDYLYGGGGNDILDGGAGRDIVTFEMTSGDMVVNLMKGFATSALSGRDRLISIENVHLSMSDDIVVGNNHDNRIDPGNGDSRLTGNGGKDAFVFGFYSMGNHVITDFEHDIDRIEIQAGQGAWNSYKDLAGHIHQQGDDVVISAQGYDDKVFIRLLNTDLKDVTSEDFLFTY